MTEEIIIDGVNVAGCEFAVKPINDNRITCHCVKGLLQIGKMQEQPESVKDGLCENNPYCYYKQLKRLQEKYDTLTNKFFNSETDKTRLEQENKQLTQWLDEARRNADFWCDKCTSLEQERDELKRACEKCKLFDIEKTNRDLLERINELEQENKELKEKVKELDKMTGIFSARLCNKYRSALEEIRENLVKLKTNDEDDFTYEYSKIEDKINEVLK